MHIRTEKNTDNEAISKVQYAAFKDHPQHQPGAEPVEHIIVERLRAAGALTLSLVWEEAGEILGHIAMSPASIGATPGGWHLLGPVGILPAHQRKGLGSALVREALRLLREGGAAGVVLVGDPEFYQRFGFRAVEGLTWPGVPAQYVLALPFAGVSPQGDIVGHAAFG